MTPLTTKYLGDIVVVVLGAAKETTKSGLFLPEQRGHPERQLEATVVGVGSKCKLPVKPGDTVLVDVYIGTRKTINKQDVVIYDSEDIIGLVIT